MSSDFSGRTSPTLSADSRSKLIRNNHQEGFKETNLRMVMMSEQCVVCRSKTDSQYMKDISKRKKEADEEQMSDFTRA